VNTGDTPVGHGAAPNGWDHHWGAYGEAARGNGLFALRLQVIWPVFGFGMRHSLDNAPLGWQMGAVATVPAEGRS
jgi:hypothetical protein